MLQVQLSTGVRDWPRHSCVSRTAMPSSGATLLEQCSELHTEALALQLDSPPDDDHDFGIPTLAQLARIEPLAWPGTAHAEDGPRTRPRTHRHDRANSRKRGRAGLDGLPLPVRQHARPAGHRLQRRRAPAATPATTTCSPPRRGWPVSSPSRRAQLPQESWFALGRLLTHQRRRAGAAVVERLDVRVPDAACW